MKSAIGNRRAHGASLDRRRLLSHALAGMSVAVPGIVASQRVYRLGRLWIGRPDNLGPPTDPFASELARLGLVEGVNLITDRRSAAGDATKLDALAAELVAARPDVLYSEGGFVAARALKKATATIPIVFESVGEPVAAGLVASLARPGGNVTGGTIPSRLELKRVQILRDVLGRSASIVMLTTPLRESRMAGFREELAAAQLRLDFEEVSKPEEFVPAFEHLVRRRADGLAVAQSVLTGTHALEIAALASKHRIPSIGFGAYFAEFGLLMSYSIDDNAISRKGAEYVYRIMKGASPADLPVEQVSQFEFVVNRKAAKALGVRIPSPVLIAATRVID